MTDEVGPDTAPEPTEGARYPHEWEADVVTSDGAVVHVRPIRPEDAEGLHRFHAGQSAESIYLRFFAPIRQLSDKDVHRFTHVDHHARVALVATIREDIAGIGRFDRIDGHDGPTAEVAFNISDTHRGRGLGSVLLEHLAAIGREIGVRRFVADVLPQNRRMINVFRDAGYEVSHEYEDGLISVAFDIEPTDKSRAVELSREHRSESRSMHQVLHPESVVVIGVSRSESSVGRALWRHLRAGEFAGRVHAVNPSAGELDGLPVFPSVCDIGEPVDLAVVAVPAEDVLQVVAECADAGVKALVVVSSGFAEADEDGERRQEELVRTARANGMRVLGPTSFGLINTDPGVQLNASLAPTVPGAGPFGLFAQSGALGIAVLASAQRRGLGISSFASAGNRVDISGNDLMQYWIDDERTSVVGLYLESIGNPRKFSRIARQLSMAKPVLVVKSGVSEYGVPGHLVRRTRERPEAFAAMLRQSGVVRLENLHQLFDVAQVLVHQPLPLGNRVAVVTNSGALGALAADAALSWDLEVTHGPVTVPPTAGVEEFTRAMAAALEDESVDSLVASFVPPVFTPDPEVVAAVENAAAGRDKPVVANFLGMRGVVAGGDLPTYPLPEDAVRALAHATRYADWKGRDHGTRVRPVGVSRGTALSLLDGVLEEDAAGRELTTEETAKLLAAYGIKVWPSKQVRSANHAAVVASKMGLPVVLKATDPIVRHQPGAQWVRTELRSDRAVRSAYRVIADSLEPIGAEGIAVQRMAPQGVAVDLSTAEDPLFGPVVTLGVAGVPADLLGDVAHRFPPLTDVDVREMVSSLRASPLLDGYRGAMPVNHGALHDLIARVSVLADDLPEVAELELNPVMAHPEGIAVLGATVRVAEDPGRTDVGRRSLSRWGMGD